MLLLAGVVGQWTYIGFVLDARPATTKRRTVSRVALGIFGVLFGVFLIIVSMPMHHVAVIYKVAAVLWAAAICWHFGGFFRKPT
jgi:hypothetical protein